LRVIIYKTQKDIIQKNEIVASEESTNIRETSEVIPTKNRKKPRVAGL